MVLFFNDVRRSSVNKHLLILKCTKENPKAKTDKFNVYSKHNGMYLGQIKWHRRWRCYVFKITTTAISSDWNVIRLKELTMFINGLKKKQEGKK